MTLLAGFDFATEISNETILELIEANLKIQGVPASPPFQVLLPISSSGVTGSVSLIVESLTVDINSDNSLSLNMSFDKTSVMVESPLTVNMCPLDGVITIKTPLLLVTSGSNKKKVVADLPNATVTVSFSAAATAIMSSSLSGLPITIDQFKAFANQAFTNFIHGMGQYVMPLEFTVIPNTDGSLSPLQFERLDLKCVGNTDRKKQALCLLGILLSANHSLGVPSQKTTTAIGASEDLCVSISPGAFHSLVFCPEVASALGANVSDLPTSCGSAGGFDTQGVTLTSLTDSFAQDHIDMNGSIDKSGTCYDAHATFHAAITMSIAGSMLTPAVAVDDPSVDVDIPWYCWLAAGLILGPLGLVITGIVNAAAESMAEGMASSAVSGALGSGLSGISVGGLGGASFNAVSVTTEGLTLEGLAPSVVIPSPESQAFWVGGSVITSTKTQISSGTYHPVFLMCDIDKDYPYAEYAQTQTAVYTAYATLLTPPISVQWEIRVPKAAGTGADVYPLTGSSGTLTFARATDYPLPLPGGSSVNQVVHVAYTKSGSTVTLTNQASEGDYNFALYASCVDCAGKSLQAYEWVSFQGDVVEIGGTFYQDQQACAEKFMQWLRKRTAAYAKPQFPPDLIGPIDYPAPEVIVESIYQLVACGAPEAEAMLLNMKVAYGSSFYRGLYSRAAAEVGLSAEAKAGLSTKANVGGSSEVA